MVGRQLCHGLEPWCSAGVPRPAPAPYHNESLAEVAQSIMLVSWKVFLLVTPAQVCECQGGAREELGACSAAVMP
jgi:hypothetical protein